ncbi:NAD kinase [Alkalilimnicola ehrlichii]|uniref:NAD kinase n=1 Tax=Alkalilimnicola ehrlichii TaxID=351052 RepID=A0A3E0WS79_9GAMM|nr:NAD(+) kinase [Alkalilimnicola ehrlichii]RFA28235.1 NAD kinase [Alkalilimnicola ehrlichii]RFA34836.1 NAD kinase [Alkalilimnicola ehrlichii]
MKRFQTIAISGKPHDTSVIDTIKRIAEHLHESGREVLIDEELLNGTVVEGAQTLPRQALASRCDLMISVGGDGTLLSAARLLVDHDVPILGVNRGRLGFLVDVSPGNLSELDNVLAGQYTADERILLTAEIRQDDRVVASGIALNDVVLYKWNSARMIEFVTYVNGELVSHNRSDGLIVSTPTGSTAYAMAGGGPIVHPDAKCMVLVPVCPHTLSNRPLVIDSSSEVEIVVHQDSIDRAGISCDGQADLGLIQGGHLIIRRHPRSVRIIHPPQYRYFDLLRAKLRWGDIYVR